MIVVNNQNKRPEHYPPKTHDKTLYDMLDWLRSKNMTYQRTDFYGRGYILDGVEMNDEEIIELFYKESFG